MKKLSVYVLFVLLYGCGGGGSTPTPTPTNGSGTVQPTSNNNTPLPVSVQIGSDKTTIMESNTYTITWTSTNATNCTAEGDWTGSVATSGSKTFTASGVGSRAYRLLCSNSSSNATGNVSVNVTKNICVNPHTDTKYPETYIGDWPIPQPTKSLNRNIVRVIGLKDYHEAGDSIVSNAIFDPNCPTNWYAKLMLTITLDKVKAMGAERVWLYNYSPWTDVTADLMVVHKPRQQYSDEMIKFVVDEANKRGIEVYYSWMYDFSDINGRNAYNPGSPISDKVYRKLLDSYINFMSDHVKYLQQVGVKGVTVDWSAMYVTNNYEHKALMNEKFSEMADIMRKNFSGKLLLNASSMFNWYDEKLFSKVDYLMVGVMPSLTETELKNKSVTAIKRSIRCHMSLTYLRFANNVPKDGRCIENPDKVNMKLPPIFFEMLVQSHKDFLRIGWVEDGFCTTGKLPDGTTSSCIQNSYVTDFSSQAFVTNAILEELTTQTLFDNVVAINAGHYWHTDEMVPKDRRGFPNISQSVRNKPAENVIRHWFAK